MSACYSEFNWCTQNNGTVANSNWSDQLMENNGVGKQLDMFTLYTLMRHYYTTDTTDCN